jgi:hypothetical protein
MNLVYLVGPPAAGKSSLMAALTGGCERSERLQPIPHQVLTDPQSSFPVAYELGKHRQAFPGTDTLAMNIAPMAKAFVKFCAVSRWPLILGEGDRLGYPGFLEASRDAGYRVTVIHVSCSERLLDVRCNLRGSKQDETWRRGRATKAANVAAFASGHGWPVVSVDTGPIPPHQLAVYVREQVSALSVLP